MSSTGPVNGNESLKDIVAEEEERAYQDWCTKEEIPALQPAGMAAAARAAFRMAFRAGVERGLELRGCCQERDDGGS